MSSITTPGVPVGDDAIVDSGACWSITVATNAVQGQYSYIQLWNPAESGKRIYLDAVTVRAMSNRELGLVWTPQRLGTAINIGVYNMKNGAQAGSVADLRIGNSAAQLLYPFVDLQYADMRFDRFILPRPAIIDPGYGLAMTDFTPYSELIGGFFWREY